MYASLGKLDLGITPRGATVKHLVQTDHRTANQITDDAALSVVFAITRCLVARKIGDTDDKLKPFRVVYQLSGDPPAFFAYVIAAAGGVLAASPDAAPPASTGEAPRIPELEALVDDACKQLAQAARQRGKLQSSVRDLAAYERSLSIGSDEHAYYAAITSLGAFAADVVRTRFADATWRYAADRVIPFDFARPGMAAASLPVFALAQRYVDARRAGTADSSDAPSTLLGIMLGETTTLVVE